MSFWLNGQLTYRPVGTTLGYIIDILPQDKKDRVIKAATLSRPISGGTYANVEFPRSLDGASQIILLSGDRITWKR